MSRLLNANPGGVGQLFWGSPGDPGRVLIREVCTSTCRHCGGVTEFESRRKMMDHVDFCRSCMNLICLPCYDRLCKGFPCVTQEAWCEAVEKTVRKHGSLEHFRGLLGHPQTAHLYQGD